MKAAKKQIRIVLIEDNRLLREGIESLLKEHDDLKITSALGTAEQIMLKIRSFKPDVILLDLGLRNYNSLEFVRNVRTRFPSSKVVAMDLIPTEGDVLEYVRAGVAGFVLKDATITDFLKTIHAVANGMKVLPSLLTSSLFSQIVIQEVNASRNPSSKLLESVRMTRREQQVIELISDGMTNKEIAQRLHLSTYTVKSHVHNILEKLALHTRVQIARYAHNSQDYHSVLDSVTLLGE
jgi:DNA-binding NarL/FixJ family response regulator